MSAPRTRKRGGRRRGGPAAEGGEDERWLLTYADMITLLMALFMVLFSISSVNTSKFETLQRALDEAFSGASCPAARAHRGRRRGEDRPSCAGLAADPGAQGRRADAPDRRADGGEGGRGLRGAQAQIDAYAKEHGISNQIDTTLRQRGLVIRVLTDKLLFDTAEATVKPPGGRCSAASRTC